MESGPCFVQFPHPGPEHAPPVADMPWNTGEHRRKFLVSKGRYLAADGSAATDELAFWGEWEAPSRIERRWGRSGRMPRALHQPYWGEPTMAGFRQNTDPWVFGETMIYSNCKQVTGPDRRPTSMQRLARGSVICFGSSIDGEFCLDTVFVIASSEPWTPAEVASMDVDEAFRICTARSVATVDGELHTSFTLYRGATLDDPVEGMFSFVPARHADLEDPRFPRPPVQSHFINPASRQSTWGSKRPLDPQTVRSEWEGIRDQVLGAGLMLAVSLETPRREGVETVPASERARC